MEENEYINSEINVSIRDQENQRIKNEFEIIKITKDPEEKLKLFKKLIEENNVEEEYILSYLLFIKGQFQEKEYIKILRKNQVCISNFNYNKYFQNDEKRENAQKKILDYITLIENSKTEKFEEKILFMSKLLRLCFKEKEMNYIPYKEITWKNEQLYLYNIYLSLLDTILKFFLYSLSALLKNIDNDLTVLEMVKSIISRNEEILNGNFFHYLSCFKTFLNGVHDNFYKRFNNDLELKNLEDKLLLEDYLQFIKTYIFHGNEKKYVTIWNETFIPLWKENINTKEIITKIQKEVKYINKIEFDEPKNNIKITNLGLKETVSIDNIYDYAFVQMSEFFSRTPLEIEWSKTTYLKPSKYEGNLFVLKKKNIWKEFLMNILTSNVYVEARKTLFSEEQIIFFEDLKLMEEIIDNIRFISYKSLFYGATCTNTFRIYERGIIDNTAQNLSISLLIFYGLFIVVNVHEIGGYINVKLQYFYTQKDIFKNTPLITNNSLPFSQYDKNRKRESGEIIEVCLFGRVIEYLTEKESLYILNKNNYKKDVNSFRNGFIDVNNKNLDELLSADLVDLLKSLDIIPDKLQNDDKRQYYMTSHFKQNINRINPNNEPRHPISFYFDNLNDKIISTLLNYFQGKLEKLPNK